MWRAVRQRLTFANVVAMLALFIALGGGFYASAKGKSKKINGSKIKPNTLPGDRIKAGTLAGDRITAGSVTNDRLGSDAQGASMKVAANGVVISATPDVSVQKAPGAGVYCIHLPFTPRGGSVTGDTSDQYFPLFYLSIPPDSADGCDGAHQSAEVNAYFHNATTAGPSTDEMFYAVF